MRGVIGLPLAVAGVADGEVAPEQDQEQEGRGVRTPARQRRSATALLSSHRGGAEDEAGEGGCSDDLKFMQIKEDPTLGLGNRNWM